MDSPRDNIGYLIHKASRRFRLRLADQLAGSGLTPQQAAALMAIGRGTDGSVTLGALADAIDTDPATTSGLVERLTRDGWVETLPNPSDGRSRLVTLTEKASTALPSVLAAADLVTAEITSCLSLDEAQTLARLLGRLCETSEPTTDAEKAGTR